MKLLVTHGYSFYGSSLWDFHGNTCNHLYSIAIFLCTDCMNYLELLTQNYLVILLIYHMSNTIFNVDLLSLLTMQPNHVTRRLTF